MKRSILLFCGIVLALCLWLAFRHTTEKNAVIEPNEAAISNQPPQAVGQLQQPTNVLQSHPKTGMEDIAEVNSNILFPSLERKKRIEESQEPWRTPIEFYGMIIDQSNNPVSGADIKFDCNDLSEKGTSYYNRKSDENGMFSLTGVRGEGISVHVSKNGYYTSRKDRDNFEYGQSSPYHFAANLGNPVVFHLQKKEKGEPLIHIGGIGLHAMRDYLLAADGKPTDVSLSTGQLMPTGQGDLQIEFHAGPPLKIFSSRITWQCKVSVPGGGIIETTEEFEFLAPENGYQKSDEWSVDDANWTEEMNKQYYVKLRDGNFGRVNIRVIGTSSPFFRLDSYVNPSGSKVLEPAQ